MLHSIYTITKTEVSFPFKEVSTETLSRVYIDREDAQNAFRQEIMFDLGDNPRFSEESLDAPLNEDPERFEFHVSKDTEIIYQIHETNIYQDQVEKLNDQAKYAESYENAMNSR